jgi:hypothetical protein
MTPLIIAIDAIGIVLALTNISANLKRIADYLEQIKNK